MKEDFRNNGTGGDVVWIGICALFFGQEARCLGMFACDEGFRSQSTLHQRCNLKEKSVKKFVTTSPGTGIELLPHLRVNRGVGGFDRRTSLSLIPVMQLPLSRRLCRKGTRVLKRRDLWPAHGWSLTHLRIQVSAAYRRY